MKNLILFGLIFSFTALIGCGVNNSPSKNWEVISDIVVSELTYSVALTTEQDSLKVDIINLTSDNIGSFTLDWRSAKSRYVVKDNIQDLPYSHVRKANNKNDIVFSTSEEGTFRIILSSK